MLRKYLITMIRRNIALLNKNDDNYCTDLILKKVFDVNDVNAISYSVKLLNDKGVIALPTDTVYGLACNANDLAAIQKIYKIKGRQEDKPIAICVKSIEDVKIWGQASHLDSKLLNEILPGPITIVLEKSKNLHNPDLNPGTSKIGIRIPKYKFIQDLCNKIDYPLALTSANKSNEPSSLNIEEFQNIWPALVGIFNGGKLGLSEESRCASTVIDLSETGYYKIIRKGVSLEHTKNIMNKFNLEEKK